MYNLVMIVTAYEEYPDERSLSDRGLLPIERIVSV